MHIKERRTKTIKPYLEKLIFIKDAFKDGVRKQFENPYTFGTATFIGLARGLTQKSGIVKGIETGAVALVAMSVISGVGNVIVNLESMKTI